MATWAREMPITSGALNLLIHKVTNTAKRSGFKMIRPLVTHTAPENNLQLETASAFTVTYYTITVQF